MEEGQKPYPAVGQIRNKKSLLPIWNDRVIISHKYKFIFIHIPKTGGSSINSTLSKICGKDDVIRRDDTRHNTAIQIKAEVGDAAWNSYFKFAFVRNPWEAVLSEYFYILKRAKPKKYKEYEKYTDFNQYLTSSKGKLILFHSMLDYIVDKSGKIAIDFVGRFENLEEDFKQVLQKIGLQNMSLPRENVTSHSHYSEYYSETAKQIVAKKFKKDIKIFGYAFVNEK